jgi:hypothetical protein
MAADQPLRKEAIASAPLCAAVLCGSVSGEHGGEHGVMAGDFNGVASDDIVGFTTDGSLWLTTARPPDNRSCSRLWMLSSC